MIKDRDAINFMFDNDFEGFKNYLNEEYLDFGEGIVFNTEE